MEEDDADEDVDDDDDEVSVLLLVIKATIDFGDVDEVVDEEEDDDEDDDVLWADDDKLPMSVDDVTVAEFGGEPALPAECGEPAPAAISDAPN